MTRHPHQTVMEAALAYITAKKSMMAAEPGTTAFKAALSGYCEADEELDLAVARGVKTEEIAE